MLQMNAYTYVWYSWYEDVFRYENYRILHNFLAHFVLLVCFSLSAIARSCASATGKWQINGTLSYGLFMGNVWRKLSQ
jgi:hypothetical protein